MATPHDFGTHARIASATNSFLGLWLISSPWIFNYSGRAAVVGNVAVGFLIGLIAGIRVATWRESAGLSGINLALGLCTASAPWTCGYADSFGGTLNSVILGVLVICLAAFSAGATVVTTRLPPPATGHP